MHIAAYVGDLDSCSLFRCYYCLAIEAWQGWSFHLWRVSFEKCHLCTLDCSGHCARLRQLADETKICRVKCPTFRFVFSKEAFERLCPPISRHLAVLTPGPLIMESFHICIGFLSCPHFHNFAHCWRRGQVWCPFLADFYLNLMEAAIWNFSISCHLSKMRVLCNI